MELKLKQNPYLTAPEVEEVAKSLLNDLTKQAKICYLFANKKTSYLGRLAKTPFETKLITGYDYFLIINMDYWFDESNDKQKEALVFHELEHIAWKPSKKDPEIGSWATKKHDVDEFKSVIYKYGRWETHLDFLKKENLNLIPKSEGEIIDEVVEECMVPIDETLEV